ncbi:Chloramphenicol acetyltransferase [compost metagenome]
MPIVHDWSEGSTLKIGKYCSIANNVQILLGGQHRIDWISSFPFPAYLPEAAHIKEFGGTRGDVVIGNDVWLCTDCTILSGVTVGHGAVVACGAVVTRNVEPYSIVAGNPAKHIRWRFDEAARQALLDAAWWDIKPHAESLKCAQQQNHPAIARRLSKKLQSFQSSLKNLKIPKSQWDFKQQLASQFFIFPSALQ